MHCLRDGGAFNGFAKGRKGRHMGVVVPETQPHRTGDHIGLDLMTAGNPPADSFVDQLARSGGNQRTSLIAGKRFLLIQMRIFKTIIEKKNRSLKKLFLLIYIAMGLVGIVSISLKR